MANNIKNITDKAGNLVSPRTIAEAVTMASGETLENELTNLKSSTGATEDTSAYQTKIDSALNTNSKNIVVAINELLERIIALENTSFNIMSYGNILLTSDDTISFTAGESVEVSVALSQAPTEDQVVSIKSDNKNIKLSKTSLIFNASNYNTPQSFTVSSSVAVKSAIITLESINVLTTTIDVIVTSA